jgi:hypothetical protein
MEAEEYETPTPSPYLSPMSQYGSSIVTMTNPDSVLYKLELTFRNCILDADGNVKSAGEPLMNDYGINSVLGTAQSVINQVTIMSNVDKGNIEGLMEFLSDTLVQDLMTNRSIYGIKSMTVRNNIFHHTVTTALITLKRAFEEGDKRFWKGSVQEIKHTQESQGGGGVWSKLNPWQK